MQKVRWFFMKRASKHAGIILLIISILAISAPRSFAVDFSFVDVIGIINKTEIDENRVFSQGDLYQFNGANADNFFTEKGAVLFWLSDVDRGELWFYANELRYENEVYMWKEVNKDYLRDVMTIINPIMSTYLDYSDGAMITFILTTAADFTKPFAKIEYSPLFTDAKNINTYDTQYSDFEKFNETVNWYLDNTVFATDENSLLSTYPTLSKGSKGEDVRKLQQRLNELGYSIGTVDGDFGNKTESALKEFQSDNGIDATGVADDKTQRILFSADAKKREATEATPQNPQNKQSDDDNYYFVPLLANLIGYSSSEWFSSGYNRALLTIVLTSDLASDEVLNNQQVLTDFVYKNTSYVGIASGSNTLLVFGIVEDSCMIIGYTPGSGEAYYTTVKFTKTDGTTGVDSSFLEMLVSGLCPNSYYQNDRNDFVDALGDLSDLLAKLF